MPVGYVCPRCARFNALDTTECIECGQGLGLPGLDASQPLMPGGAPAPTASAPPPDTVKGVDLARLAAEEVVRPSGPILGGAAARDAAAPVAYDDGAQPLDADSFGDGDDTELTRPLAASASSDTLDYAGSVPEPAGRIETTDHNYRRFVEAAAPHPPGGVAPSTSPSADVMVFHPPTIPPGEALAASSLFPAVSVEEGLAVERSENLICSKCNSLVHPGHKFCGKCGTPVEEFATKRASTNLFGPMQQVGKAKLVLIKGEGFDGISYHLNAKEHIAGRSEGAIIFPDDPFLSPRHTNFFYREGRLFLRDDGSLNGTYVRVRESEPLNPGDFFLAGEQIFRFEVLDPYRDEPEPDGTLFFASPPRPSTFRIVQILSGGKEGLIYNAKRDALVIGRERSDVNFPIDRYMSGSHTKLEARAGAYGITDMGSKNGTFLRVRGERELQHGDYVFIGQQLLRVEITAF
ncbi:MAG TPA: FHA domain-containing protein [Myxococcota bacterium]|jgi:pSer/pThr/pTyr-binding forkhead associated (FHA) protein|nr:FHA domain-containing protein [Myxococcota bacterium]